MEESGFGDISAGPLDCEEEDAFEHWPGFGSVFVHDD
jgi:hypothetical protein